MIISRYLTIENYRLHFLEAGAGPPVVLLHGFAGAAEDWRPSLELLAHNGYHALAVDLLGFGRSAKPGDAPYSLQLSADLLVGLLARLGLERATFAAHSMGGKYALATALLHPHRVKGLVLIDTDGFVEPYTLPIHTNDPLIPHSLDTAEIMMLGVMCCFSTHCASYGTAPSAGTCILRHHSWL
ncbi:MAG: alpha/beta fold hydrolase [Chloroflexaceae bacterium]|jgi:pimeloyl-ACP methyl ester carboxylesterase|nr:alpha/beta fold hydrolase [Chloroflexaceae bacterium]